jgi:hypothetical protein
MAHMLAVVGLGPFEFLIGLIVFAVVLVLTAFWLWMLVDCAKRIGAGDDKQVIWLIVIALTQVLGAVAYFCFGRSSRAKIAS